MSIDELLQFLHVASAFAFVTGVIGRDIVLAGARRADDVGRIQELVQAAGPFERYLVIPGSFLVLVLGVLTWWAQELPLWGDGTGWVTVSLLAFVTAVPLVPLVFLPRGKVFEAALASSLAAGRMTSELSTALRDPVVAAARWYELVVTAFVLLLMVTKPF
jgi:Predicted integral membrane protein (DUF2269)